jgi:nitroreductase
MSVIEVLKQRHSTRAFTQQTVSQKQIERLLEAASHAPSGANTQPWQVAVITGDTKSTLCRTLEKICLANEPAQADYQYYAKSWTSPYIERRKACGLQLYQSLNIDKKDSEARLAQWAANYRAFDAPVLLLFFIDQQLEVGSYLDYGMYLQSLMLAAQELGLATCPQAAFADYPEQVRNILRYSRDKHLICGIALGYEDTDAAINSYRTNREPVSTFTQFFN